MPVKDEHMGFIEASMARDEAMLNLEGTIRAIAEANPDMASFVDVLTKTLIMVGPELFRAGYLAGATTGMEVARAISKGVK